MYDLNNVLTRRNKGWKNENTAGDTVISLVKKHLRYKKKKITKTYLLFQRGQEADQGCNLT